MLRKTPKGSNNDKVPVEVSGSDGGLALSLANCCSPIPGDPIIGYISKGKGIVVHRTSCPNVVNLKRRLIPVNWKEDLGINKYRVDIKIYSNDRANLLADILQCLAAKGVGVSDLNAHLVSESNISIVELTAYVTDAKLLNDCFADLMGVKGIYDIERQIH